MAYSSADELSAAIGRAARAVVDDRKALLAAANAAAALQRKAPGFPRRPVKGVKVGVTVKMERGGALVRATKPAHLAINPTKAHRIKPRRRRGKKAILIPGVGPRANAQHPGTKGTRSWQKTMPQVERVAPKVYFTAQTKAVTRALKG